MLLAFLICMTMLMNAIALLVLVKNPKDRANRAFAVFLASGSGWLIANYFASNTNIPVGFLVFIDMNVMALPAICLFALLRFVVIISNLMPKVSHLIKTLIWSLTLTVILGSYSPLLVETVVNLHGSNQIVFGPLSAVYFTYVALVFMAVISILLIRVRIERGIARIRMQYILASLTVSIAISLVCNLIMPLVLHNYSLVQVGPLSTVFIIVGFTYAIVKHRLFDIRLVVARSVAYVLLLFSLGLAYSSTIVGMSSLVFKQNAPIYQAVIQSLLALILALTFQPVRRFFERVTNNVFYRDHYDSQEVINNFSKILVSERDLDRILKRSLQALTESLHIGYAQIVVFNNDRVYRVAHFGNLPRRLMVAPELARLNKPMIIADELGGGERKELLERHGIRISMTLRTSEDFVGYLLLGDKLSGDIYSAQDIKLLEIIGKELAVAILNAKAYAEIQAFNVTLQARVDHATNRLRVANRHLKELDHAKDEFISMASHQLRTPLTTIKGYLSMLLEGDAGAITPAQKDFVDYAFGASERMVNLISDLLNVSRLSAGRFLIQTKPTDMVKMVEDEVRQLQTHATAKGIALVFDKPETALVPAEIDDNKTRQVIMNFIDNAIYYTQTGEVRVILEEPHGHVRLEVRDTGIGVPEKAKKKLFSKFFRADNAQTVRPDGTGLGLYLAKRVIEDQGGTIIFSSIEGKGSTFGFELPLKPLPSVKAGRPHGRHH